MDEKLSAALHQVTFLQEMVGLKNSRIMALENENKKLKDRSSAENEYLKKQVYVLGGNVISLEAQNESLENDLFKYHKIVRKLDEKIEILKAKILALEIEKHPPKDDNEMIQLEERVRIERANLLLQRKHQAIAIVKGSRK